MSDPTKFPQMHIAESVWNRIQNMQNALLPPSVPIPEMPTQKGQPVSADQITKGIQSFGGSGPNMTEISNTAIQGADINESLASGSSALGTGAADVALPAGGAEAAGAGAAAAGASGILGAGAAGTAAGAGAAAVAGEALATGSELLPLLALA